AQRHRRPRPARSCRRGTRAARIGPHGEGGGGGARCRGRRHRQQPGLRRGRRGGPGPYLRGAPRRHHLPGRAARSRHVGPSIPRIRTRAHGPGHRWSLTRGSPGSGSHAGGPLAGQASGDLGCRRSPVRGVPDDVRGAVGAHRRHLHRRRPGL
ncbi:MAG: YbaK/prolyl-tRNA synthetase associated region, partial [uncultured Nocardioidaceae bacterium]